MATELLENIGKKITDWKPWQDEIIVHSVDVTGDCPVNPAQKTLRVDYAKTPKGILFNLRMRSGISNSNSQYHDLIDEIEDGEDGVETLSWIALEYNLTIDDLIAMVRRNLPILV